MGRICAACCGKIHHKNPCCINKSVMPSMWRVARFTHYLYFSFYYILLKQLFYYIIWFWAFLYCHQKEVCIVPPSPLSLSNARHGRIQVFLKEVYFLFLFKHTYSSIKMTLHCPSTAILWFSVQPQPLIRSS